MLQEELDHHEDRAGKLRLIDCADIRPRDQHERWLESASRRGGVSPKHWCDSLETSYCDPPTDRAQHSRQRVLAIVLAMLMAMLLAYLAK